MGLGEITAYIDAYNARRRDNVLLQWQTTRYLAFTMYRTSMAISESSAPKRPSELFTLEGDEEVKKKAFNKRAAMRMRKKILEAWKTQLDKLN